MKPKKAYCINLDSRPDRWEQVCEDFKRLQKEMDIELERVPAIENKKVPKMGLTETVKNIIRRAKREELPYVLFIEDDLFVVDAKKVVECLSNVPEDWDVLLGGVYYYKPLIFFRSIGEIQHWDELTDFCSLHFTIINSRAYDTILGLNAGSRNFDRVIGEQVKRKKLRAFVMYPMPCQQRPGYSDLRQTETDDNKRGLPWVRHPDLLK